MTNILWKPKNKNLKIIDWEYVCIADPIMDLTNLVLSCQLNNQQEKKLLHHYTEKMGVSIEPKKLSDMKTLSYSLFKLWELAQ